MTKPGGASWGKKRFTSIMLVGCKTKRAGKDCGEAPYKQDKGQFAERRQADHHGRDRPEVPRALLRIDIASLAGRERRR